MHWSNAAPFLQKIWCPGFHQLNMARFYRFKDPRLEAQYTRHTAAISRTILVVYCVLYFSLAVERVVKHPLDCPQFWMIFAVCGSSLALGLASVGRWPWIRALPVHAPYVCVLSSLLVWYLRLASAINDKKYVQFVQGDVHPLDMDHGMQVRLEMMVHNLNGSIEVLNALFFNTVHWVSLSFAGWNAWTLLAHLTVFVASSIGLFANSPMYKELMLFDLILISIVFIFISVATEKVRRSSFLAQTLLAQELQASQLADGVLNHMLKNALADVAADIEIFLTGELGPEVLNDAVVCLRRGMRSCRERVVYLKMVAGEYVPVLNAVKVREFGQELAAGRNVDATQLPDCTILMDSILMQLILENALSNAAKHGHPDHPDVQLTVQVEAKDGAAVGPQPTLRRVCFTVMNVAHPLQPQLTDDVVRPLLDGQSASPRHFMSVVPTLSDGIGLRHCGLAARLGGIDVSLTQEGDVVKFSAALEAEVLAGTPSSSTEDEVERLALQCPAALTICCLDDSASSRRLLEYHLKRGFPAATVRVYGAEECEVQLFLREAMKEAHIVVLDQNLQYPVNFHFGTDLCRHLVSRGFPGLLCIRSSDDSPEDQARFAASGAHCSFGKDILGANLVQHLKAAYVSNVLRPGPDLDRWAPSPSPPSPCAPPRTCSDAGFLSV